MASKKTEVEKALENLLPGDGLKVGAKSSFFYCGTVNDFLKRNDAYSLECERRAAHLAKKAMDKLKRLLSMDSSPSGYASAVSTSRDDRKLSPLTMEAYRDWVVSYFKAVESQFCVVERAEENAKRVVPLLQREVVRFEKSSSEDGCWILVLSGNEIGGFWTLADAGVKGSHISFAAEEKDYV